MGKGMEEQGRRQTKRKRKKEAKGAEDVQRSPDFRVDCRKGIVHQHSHRVAVHFSQFGRIHGTAKRNSGLLTPRQRDPTFSNHCIEAQFETCNVGHNLEEDTHKHTHTCPLV